MKRRPATALGVLLLAAAPAAPQAGAVRAWLDGRTADALGELGRLPESRERDFNRAVVLLHRGEAEQAEAAFRRLATGDAEWLPALRWLARAQRDLGREAASETAAALLRSRSATASDEIWAARLFAERGLMAGARDAFRRAATLAPDLHGAWAGLADAEAALGNAQGSRAAAARAEALRAGDATLAGRLPPLPERGLRYKAKYLFVPLADVTLAERALVEPGARAARELVLTASASGPLFRMDSRFESLLDADGGLVARRQVSGDTTSARRQAVIELDPQARLYRARQVRDGLFHYDVLPAPDPARAYDGPSLVDAARAVARSGTPVSVLRLADAGWKGTSIRRTRAEKISWQGREVETVRVEIGVGSRGAAGLQGALELWISADERALPYRARMGIAIGSVTLELQPDEPPGPRER